MARLVVADSTPTIESPVTAYTPKPVWTFDDVYDGDKLTIPGVASFVPPRGFIHEYVRYAVQCTDAPPLYHILSSAGVVSAAIAPHLDLEDENVIYPLHLFLLIIGESASRKSSAIRRARKVAEPVFQLYSQRGNRIWPLSTSSPEGVLEELHREPNRLVILNEWSSLHRTSGKAKYWAHASEMWNELYDGDDQERTLAGGKKFKITRPRITILGGSTRSLVLDAVDRVDWLGGKMGRYIIGCMERPQEALMLTQIDRPADVDRLRGMLKDLIAPVASRSNARLSREARDLVDGREADPHYKAIRDSASEHLLPSFGRAREHIIRLAGVYEASMREPHEDVVVGWEAMQPAIDLVEWCLETQVQAFPLLEVEKQSALAKVSSLLRAVGSRGLDRSSLLRRSKLMAKVLNETIQTLVESKQVSVKQEVSGNGKGPPATIYRFEKTKD